MTAEGRSGPDLVGLMPFADLAGVVLDAASGESATGHLDWREDRCTAGGVLHGGVLMTLADSVGAACAHLGLPDGAQTATTSSQTYFLRPVTEGTVTATTRPLHRGRNRILLHTELHDATGRLVGYTVQTQAVLTT